MAVYKFRVTFDEQDDVFREIEIKSSQPLETLHHAILDAINFEGNVDASFYISDDFWRKGEELKLKSNDGSRLMAKSKIVALIDDPHQKFVYVYDPKKTNWTLLVELIKILPDDPNKEYPVCVKSEGIAPKAVKKPVNAADLLEEEDDFEDGPESDADAYKNAHSEEAIEDIDSEDDELDDFDDLDEGEEEMMDPDEEYDEI